MHLSVLRGWKAGKRSASKKNSTFKLQASPWNWETNIHSGENYMNTAKVRISIPLSQDEVVLKSSFISEKAEISSSGENVGGLEKRIDFR